MSRKRYVPIYLLRTKCDDCSIDTMRTFVLKDGENPTHAFEQMEDWAKKRWPKDHPLCAHRVMYQWITEKDYKYDLKKKEPVRR